MRKKAGPCSLDGCDRPEYCRGLCAGHRKQQVNGLPFGELRPYRVNTPHTCVEHPPGSSGCYSRHGCRCRECREVQGRLRKRRAGTRVRYVEGMLMARPLQELCGMGWMPSEIAAATGLSRGYVDQLRRGFKGRVTVATASRIVAARKRLGAVPPPNDKKRARRYAAAAAYQKGWGPNPMVLGVGTNRRLQALSALGWLDGEIGALAGLSAHRVGRLREMAEVPAKDAAQVMQAYDAMSMRLPLDTPPHRQRRTRAKNLGFQPPLAWDDEDLDDPDATPYVPEKPRGRHQRRYDPEDLEWMAQTGAGLDEVGMRLNLTRGGVVAVLHRVGRPDLAEKMRAVVA